MGGPGTTFDRFFIAFVFVIVFALVFVTKLKYSKDKWKQHLGSPTVDLVLGHESKEVEAETRTFTPSSHLQQSRLRYSQMNNISIASNKVERYKLN